MKIKIIANRISKRRLTGAVVAFCLVFALLSGLSLPISFDENGKFTSEGVSFAPKAGATNTYFNLASGNLSLSLTNQNAAMIDSNNDWTAIASVEGYKGTNLTDSFPNTYGIDPQLVTATEFVNNTLPSGNTTQIQANKGNPNAVNNGGLAEFDSGPYICFGFQGNVQANPYMVFYVNTLGRTNVRMSYRVTDIDAGSNDSVSRIALQYRIGTTGSFINIPDGFVSDATDPNVAGRVTTRNILLPAAIENQGQVQLRLILTDAAGTDGSSTPDEWIGVNNIVIGNFAPTAAGVNVGGRVISPLNRPLSGATVLMYDSTGSIRQARTNPFGYYNFDGVLAGQTYFFEIRSRKYAFSQPFQTIFVTEDLENVDFNAAFNGKNPTGIERLKFEY